MPILFAADECFPGPIVRKLREAGSVVVDPTLGWTDVQVLAAAFPKGRIVLSRDADMERLVLIERRARHGLFILRLPQKGGWRERAPWIADQIQVLGQKLNGMVTILDLAGVRQTLIPKGGPNGLTGP